MSFTTHVIKTGTLTLTRGNSDPTLNLNNYDGFFYYLAGAGGNGYNAGTTSTGLNGGNSGFVNSNYINLLYPYNIQSIVISFLAAFNNGTNKSNGGTIMQLFYSNDPTGGNQPFTLIADNAQVNPSVSISGYDGSIPIGYYHGSASQFLTTNGNFITQRSNNPLNISGYTGAEGSINPIFGYENRGYYAGAGFYGGAYIQSGATGPFGYSSGGWYNSNNGQTSGVNGGYAVITLIPITNIYTGSSAVYVTDTTINTNPEGLMLCSLLGGGGGGGFSHSDADDEYNYGSGGGGSGAYQLGLQNVSSNTNIVINIGAGGAAGYAADSGEQGPGAGGENTTLTVNSKTFKGLYGGGGFAVYNKNASGGAGYFGGGSGMGGASESTSSVPAGGVSYVHIPTYISTINDRGTYNPYYALLSSVDTNYAGNGKGYVSTNYGQGGLGSGSNISTGSGGGGGPYGGNGASGENSRVASAALGYGCGGGGGCHQGGTDYFASAGTAGYAIVSFLPTNSNFIFITVDSVTPIRTFNYIDFINYKGFWYFLQGEEYLPELNMGHFLIQDDGVQQITLNFTTLSITVKFNSLNLNGNTVTQTFSLSAAKGNLIIVNPPLFLGLLFYK